MLSYDLRILRNKKLLAISLTRGNKTTHLSRNDLLFIMCQWHALGPEEVTGVNILAQNDKLFPDGFSPRL